MTKPHCAINDTQCFDQVQKTPASQAGATQKTISFAAFDVSEDGDALDSNEAAAEAANTKTDIFTQRAASPSSTDTNGAGKKKAAKAWKKWCISIAAVVAVAVIAVLLLLPGGEKTDPQPTAPTVVSTSNTTVDPVEQARLLTYLGEWVDEQSTGKGNIPLQGGGILTVHSIEGNVMSFDLISYSGGDDPTVASLINGVGTINHDKVTFSFEDDGLGNSGSGYMLLLDQTVDIETTLDNVVTGPDGIPLLPTHSLAMNAHFARVALPHSDGVDIRQFDTLEKVREEAGEETAEPVKAENGTVYTFGMLRVTAREDGSIAQLQVDYSNAQDKSRYRYDCVDGTMTYETVKNYFGEAVSDYTEQPTNICVLKYTVSATEKTEFTFDAQDNLLINILYER